jgi:hypothetical protein
MASVLFSIYFIVFLTAFPYFNFQYAKTHGFFNWFFFGEIIPSVQAAVWPYYVVQAMRARGVTTATPAPDRIYEYTDNNYSYAFQYPSTWKIQPTPKPGEAGEVRVVIQSATKRSNVMAIVGQLGKSITRQQFETSPKRDDVVNGLIDLTVEQVYKKMSTAVGASRIIVAERRALESDAGIKFYIATAMYFEKEVGEQRDRHDRGVMGVAGQHIVPFEKDYVVSFLMVSPVDPKATEENATLTNVFNSFHVTGERPR